MKPKHIRKLLLSEIETVVHSPDKYCINPQRDFSRTRKLPFATVVKSIIGMESGSLKNELIDVFNSSPSMPTSSAFIQQRNKIKPETFKDIFSGFTEKLMNKSKEELPIFAVDGSDLQIATNPSDKSSYCPRKKGHKACNFLHLNALYDIKRHIYVDAIIQGCKVRNEHSALQTMVDCSTIPKALVIADRGYESYNSMAHIQEKGWFFLIRIKDGASGIKAGLDLPIQDEFDIDISLKLTRKQTNEVKELCKDKNQYKFISQSMPFDYLPKCSRKADPVQFYRLDFRIVRFKIAEDTFETVLTNLNGKNYKPADIKSLYAARWGIETSFRDLKYTIGLIHFHSKKVTCIHQEIYAHMIMYNFAEMITSHVVIEKKQRKYTYKANFTVAVHMCRLFYHGKTTSPNLETIITQNINPIRPGRRDKRRPTTKSFCGFLYRVA